MVEPKEVEIEQEICKDCIYKNTCKDKPKQRISLCQKKILGMTYGEVEPKEGGTGKELEQKITDIICLHMDNFCKKCTGGECDDCLKGGAVASLVQLFKRGVK